MSDFLIPGYEALADQELARRAVIHRIDRLPWATSLAAGAIHVIDTRADAEAWVDRLHDERVSMMGVDTEFSFDGPEVKLRGGDKVTDLSTIRPLVCTVAAWCGVGRRSGEGGDPLIRLLFDLRRPEVHPALKDLLGSLRVPWIAHSAKAELQCLWACGIEPAEQLLIDTFTTAACLNLGRFHWRQAGTDPGGEVAGRRKSKEKIAHLTSLVGQCEHYGFAHPFAHLKDRMRERFLRLGRDEPLDRPMIEYAMSDAAYALRLHLAQAEDVQRLGLAPHLATIEWPMVGVIARMELAGMPFDPGRATRYQRLCREIYRVMAERLVPYGIKPGSRDSFLNAMSRAGVLHHFVRDGKLSTVKEVLEDCERLGVHAAVRFYRLHDHFRRLASGDVLSGRLVGADGRLRCSLDQLLSVSGRIASSKPNLIGLDARIRPVFSVGPESVLIELDKSQIEIGCAAAEWDDPDLIRLFNSADSYASVALSFYRDRLTFEEASLPPAEFMKARRDLRNQVKPLMLGIIYGKGAQSVAADLGRSAEHAERELRRFFDHFPGVREGAKRAMRASLRRGYGLTATGLRRHVEPGDGRQRNAMRNHPIQGTAAAIFKAAIIRIDRYYRGTSTRLLLPRHDSVLIQTPKETEQDVISTCRIFMIGEIRAIYPQLQPRIEHLEGISWPTKQTLEEYLDEECPGEAGGLDP
jgi:DNA polymerase family A